MRLDPEEIQAIAAATAELLKPHLLQSTAEEDVIYDVKGLAAYLRVKEQYVYQRVHTRTIPFFKVGKFPRFRKSMIDKWLEEGAK